MKVHVLALLLIEGEVTKRGRQGLVSEGRIR